MSSSLLRSESVQIAIATHIPIAKRHRTSAAVRCDTGGITRKAGRISPCALETYVTLVSASASACTLIAVRLEGTYDASCSTRPAIVVAASDIARAGNGYALVSQLFTPP